MPKHKRSRSPRPSKTSKHRHRERSRVRRSHSNLTPSSSAGSSRESSREFLSRPSTSRDKFFHTMYDLFNYMQRRIPPISGEVSEAEEGPANLIPSTDVTACSGVPIAGPALSERITDEQTASIGRGGDLGMSPYHLGLDSEMSHKENITDCSQILSFDSFFSPSVLVAGASTDAGNAPAVVFHEPVVSEVIEDITEDSRHASEGLIQELFGEQVLPPASATWLPLILGTTRTEILRK
ncbi:uncharacterized protein LOC105287852 isoform X4 [Ooceraea biroi]|uniref:uncharacterized protein LOC105287852 isoform X4 n=1 Tax=Ooceraea biroi TaxID=2015173 RepID=UPI0005B9129D|nr:uncharacterized protein LOC105287852 isoform X4 [Ooceraea biroi]